MVANKVKTHQLDPVRYAGYADTAVQLIEHFTLAEPVVTRQQLYEWARRRTINRAGELFPVTRWPGVLDPGKVIGWAAKGVPGPRGHGWRMLGPVIELVDGMGPGDLALRQNHPGAGEQIAS